MELCRRKADSHRRVGSLSKVSIAKRQNLNASSKVGSNLNSTRNQRQVAKSIDQTRAKSKDRLKEKSKKVP